MTPELRELVDVLQTKGSNVKIDELQSLRKKVIAWAILLHAHHKGIKAC
jgi:hypothetical protein